MVANAQSQPITSLPVDSGASRGNQPLLPSKKRSTRDFTIAPVERSSAGTLPLLQKTKMCTPVPPNFIPCGAQNALAGARFSLRPPNFGAALGPSGSLPAVCCGVCGVSSPLRRSTSRPAFGACSRLQRQQAGDPLQNERPTRVIVWNGLQGASGHFDATSLLECGTAV